MVLRARFIEKVYSADSLDGIISDVETRERITLLDGKVKKVINKDFNFAFLTTFLQEYWDIRKIASRHLGVWRNDWVLGPALPDSPDVVFRGVPL